MKPLIILTLLFTNFSGYATSMFLHEEGHCHYNIDYLNGQWQTSFRHDTEGVWPLDTIINHARSAVWPNGSRFIRPAGSEWDFTGVAAGEPIYIFPQASPGSVLWPSFSSDQTPLSAFAAYSITNDLRVPPAPTRWVTYHLLNVRYWGDGTGHFSIWNSSIAGSLIWMSTADGIGSNDSFLMEVGGHIHMNWGFSDIGWYEIDACASAYITYPTVHTTSPPARIYFGIGVTGAPPAELSIQLEANMAPWITISAPGPGTNRLQSASLLAGGMWTDIATHPDSMWHLAVTNFDPALFFRLTD